MYPVVQLVRFPVHPISMVFIVIILVYVLFITVNLVYKFNMLVQFYYKLKVFRLFGHGLLADPSIADIFTAPTAVIISAPLSSCQKIMSPDNS